MSQKTRRQREREARRRAILEAAVEVLSERGPEGASMKAIADRAELSKGLLYYYFEDRQRLYREAALLVVERFFQDLDDHLPPEAPLPELLEAYLRFTLDRFRTDRLMLRVVADYMGHAAPRSGRDGAMRRSHGPWLERSLRALRGTPWADDPSGFQAFVFDATVVLKDLCLAGRDHEAERRIAFWTDLVRRAAACPDAPRSRR